MSIVDAIRRQAAVRYFGAADISVEDELVIDKYVSQFDHSVLSMLDVTPKKIEIHDDYVLVYTKNYRIEVLTGFRAKLTPFVHGLSKSLVSCRCSNYIRGLNSSAEFWNRPKRITKSEKSFKALVHDLSVFHRHLLSPELSLRECDEMYTFESFANLEPIESVRDIERDLRKLRDITKLRFDVPKFRELEFTWNVDMSIEDNLVCMSGIDPLYMDMIDEISSLII